MKKISFFTNKIKLIAGILLMLLLLAGFWLEPFSSVNILNAGNWQYIIGLKTIGDLALVIAFLYILIKVLKDAEISKRNKLINFILLGLISAFFAVSLTNSLKDLTTGAKIYTGGCELDRTTSKYFTTNDYMYLLDNDPKKYIRITQQDFEDLEGYYRSISPGNPYKCNRNVEVYYLEHTGVSLEVK